MEESAAKIRATSLPEVAGNEVQFVQLFQNLIENAIKYRRPNTRPVIDISPTPEANGSVIAVRDNGLGFDAEFTEWIFKPFQRFGVLCPLAVTGGRRNP